MVHDAPFQLSLSLSLENFIPLWLCPSTSPSPAVPEYPPALSVYSVVLSPILNVEYWA